MQPQVEQMLKKLEHLRQDYADASEAAFNRVWDNDEDAIYDTL